MHSRVFQISTTRIEKDNYLNDNTLQQGDGCYFDYCADIDDEERKEDIANLVKYALPKGMFEITSDDTIRYNGGIEKWKEEYVANIRKKAETITAENMLKWGPLYYLKQALIIAFIWMGQVISLLPSNPLPLWNLSAPLNRARHSTSEESSTIISNAQLNIRRPLATKAGGCLLFIHLGVCGPTTFIAMLLRASLTGFTTRFIPSGFLI